MRGALKLLLAVALAVSLAGGLSACGDDDSGADSTVTTAPETSPPTTAEDRGSTEKEPQPGDDRGGEDTASDDSGPASQKGSASFRVPGGDNSIQNFGAEADTEEVAAADAALSGYLQARADGEWARQCSFMARSVIEPIEQLALRSPELKGKGCAAALAALSSDAPAAALANPMTEGVASLRIEGERGFALYHGSGGIDYVMPMLREDGEWKVGAVAPSELS